MKISYKNSIQDLVDFKLFYFKTSPSFNRISKISKFGMPLLILLVLTFYYFVLDMFSIPFTLCMILLSFLWIIFYPKFYVWKTEKEIINICNDPKNAPIHLTVTLDDYGITKETSMDTLKVSWIAITKIVELQNHILIYLNSLNPLIVPINIFEDSVQKDSFLKYLYQKANIDS